MTDIKPTIGYTAYIDEAGDDGLRTVMPHDPNGASEWFVLAALVVEQINEPNIVGWRNDILQKMESLQRRDIHYQRLSPQRRLQACELLAALPVRCFVVISNKKNMRQHRNSRAAAAGSKNYFYNWITRTLLEKVSDHCYRHSLQRHNEARRLRVEFSARGGMSYDHTREYFRKLKTQTEFNMLHITTDNLSWPVMDMDEFHAFPHESRAGLQLADIVAGAFYQSLGFATGKIGDPSYAMVLRDRMAKSRYGNCFGYGVKLLPNYDRAHLVDHQRRIFEFFGAPPKRRQAPGS